jgi:transcriptional regulator with XRE-family HTH domain
MSTNDRLRSRGAARARRILGEFAVDMRTARLHAGLSQEEVGSRAGLSGDKVWRAEHEALATLSISDACRMAAVLGLDFAARTYESGVRIRDVGQAKRLAALSSFVGPPLRYVTDAPLPAREGIPERRAWDALISGSGERSGVELESRITDMQATTRRHNEKRRDDPVDHFLLVVADTRHNRRVMAEFAPLLGDLPHLRTASVLAGLQAGKHPPDGWIFL